MCNSDLLSKAPVDCEDDSCSKEVWVVCRELSGDLLVGFQSPGFVVSAAVQLVYLSGKKRHSIMIISKQVNEHIRYEWDIVNLLVYLREQSPELQIHDIVPVEFSQALVVIVSEHRGICDQTPDCIEGLFKPAPYHILAGVHCLWILIGEERQVAHDAESNSFNSVDNIVYILLRL